MAAIDAEVYIYTDDSIAYAGYAESGGTAYPLAEKDGKLYTAGNHFVTKYAVTDGKLVVMETADDTQENYDDLWDEYCSADILVFDEIK